MADTKKESLHLNTFGRRDFLKVGLTAGGLTAAGGLLSVPLTTYTEDKIKTSGRPWWVEEVDKPVLAIDDKTYGRFDPGKDVLRAFDEYAGPEQLAAIRAKKESFIEACREENRPGYRMEDIALESAGWRLRGTGSTNRGMRVWNERDRRSSKPRKKWQGSPQEAADIVKRAAIFFGAGSAGVAEVDQRHIFTQAYGKEIVISDTEDPYEEDGKRLYFPDKCKYVVALTVRMSLHMASLAPSRLCDATTSLGYSRAEFLVGLLSQFIRNLGYTAVPSVNDVGPSMAFAVEAGLGEVGRTNRLITPEFGPAVQLAKVFTDLPMKPDRPIRFGVREFCTVCKRCAEACPSGALSSKDQPDFEIAGPWNNPGHATWFEDSVSCFQYWEESNSYCSVCIQVCPWHKQNRAQIHEIVRAASAKIPALDRFFVHMDRSFGYGCQKDPTKWWRMNLPEHGLDSRQKRS